jgi:hypothetical protein
VYCCVMRARRSIRILGISNNDLAYIHYYTVMYVG